MSQQSIGQRISAGRQALRDGRIEVALNIATEVLAGTPDNLDALEIKALAEIERGDDGSAERTLRRAIEIAPERRWPYADLSRHLLKLGRTTEAESVARAALASDKGNADAHALLGAIHSEREAWVSGAAHFKQALAIAGPHPHLLLGLGRALVRQGRLDAARPLLEAAAAADPSALDPLVYLAELEERKGEFELAMKHLDRAEAIAAATGTDVTLQRSVLLERMGKIDDAHALLDSIADLSGAALLQRGRLRDRLGRHAEAWNDWVAGKAVLAKKNNRSYPAGEVQKQINALAAFFDRARSAELPRARRRGDTPQPIFILGFPRSGTTLVEQILASHSAIRAGGELPFAAELKQFAASLVGGEANFPAGLADLAEERPNWPELLRDFYLAKAADLGLIDAGAGYFTDKMPLNEMWLPLLRLAFPESPFVLVRRHPLDVLTSVIAHDMTHGFNCAYRLDDAAHHLAAMERLLARYRQAGFEVTHELRYEELVADQLGETERLMTAIGLPLEPAQLRFHERAAVSPTPSYAQVREGLNDRSVGRWRHYERQLESARSLLAEAVMRGGYSL